MAIVTTYNSVSSSTTVKTWRLRQLIKKKMEKSTKKVYLVIIKVICGISFFVRGTKGNNKRFDGCDNNNVSKSTIGYHQNFAGVNLR